MIKNCMRRERADFPGCIIHENEVYATIHNCTGYRHMCPYDGRLPAESCNDFRKEDDK